MSMLEIVCTTDTIIEEIALDIPRKSVALTYAMLMRSQGRGGDRPDWPRINKAIIEKWGLVGLEAVKKRAWRLIEGKELA